MNNYKCYIKNLRNSTMEKLFFVDKLDLSNKLIIDFGCADGYLLSELQAYVKEHNITNTEYIGVEKDIYLKELAQRRNINNCSFVEDIDELLDALKYVEKEIILVCSSVLHECTYDMQWVLSNFAERKCNYIVIRDMYFDNDFNTSTKVLGKVIRYSNPNRLSTFAEKYGLSKNRSIAHYLLKYTYIDNWETELEENYFSTVYSLYDNCSAFSALYDYKYLLNYKATQIQKDFDIDFETEVGCYTHRQVIYKNNKLTKN